MSEYGAVPPPGTGAPLGGQTSIGNGGGIKKDAFADAVQRARQVRESEREGVCLVKRMVQQPTTEDRFNSMILRLF